MLSRVTGKLQKCRSFLCLTRRLACIVKTPTSLEQVTPVTPAGDLATGGEVGTPPAIRTGRSPAALAGAPPAAWIARPPGVGR
jgi:hypothetical protein